MHNGVLFSHNKEFNCVVCRKMDGTEDYHIEWEKLSLERQMSHAFTHMWNRDIKCDMSIKEKLFQEKQKEEGGENKRVTEVNMFIYFHVCMKMA
jgi:hypothetical protein